MLSAESIAIISVLIAALSFFIAGASAFYAWRSAKEANKANDIGRLNALFSFRQHYLERIVHDQELAKIFQAPSAGMQACENAHANLDSKLREIIQEITDYHTKVVENKI